MREAKAFPFLLATYLTPAAHDPGWPFAEARGYGVLISNKQRFYAHRLAWTLAHGPIPDGMHVCHHCDTPACFWVEHLFLGTPGDNMRDAAAKGRKQGELQRQAKLTRDAVTAIRSRYAAGGVSQRALAAEYSVSQWTIGRVVLGRRWTHVSD